jgi:hypothetical protein
VFALDGQLLGGLDTAKTRLQQHSRFGRLCHAALVQVGAVEGPDRSGHARGSKRTQLADRASRNRKMRSEAGVFCVPPLRLAGPFARDDRAAGVSQVLVRRLATQPGYELVRARCLSFTEFLWQTALVRHCRRAHA